MALRAHQEALLRNAVNHALRGWYVFPLRPNDKRPAFPDHNGASCTGRDPRCQAAGTHVGWEARATLDPDRIHRAWSRRPYNIGIACGPSNLVGVDLDQPKPGKPIPDRWRAPGIVDGADVLAVLCDRAGASFVDLTTTFTVRTVSGGTHLYYRHPEPGPRLRNTTGEHGNGLGWLVDTRADGGYLVAAGSTVDGCAYTVTCDMDPVILPDWLATRLTPGPLPQRRRVVVNLTSGRRASFLRAAVNSSVEAIGAAGLRDNGTLNTTLYGASVALGQLVAGGSLDPIETEDLLVDAAVSAGHPAGTARRTIQSGFRTGTQRPRSVAA